MIAASQSTYQEGAVSTINDSLLIGAEMGTNLNVEHSIPGLDNWHPSDMVWTDAERFPEGISVVAPISHSTHEDNHGESVFSNIEILSMMPKNGMDFEADYSTYLFNSGYSPLDQTEGSSRAQGNTPLLWETISGVPVPIGAKAVPFLGNSEPGTFTRMPSVMKETPRKLPIPVVDHETYDIIMADIKNRLSLDQVQDFEILGSQGMQRFLTSYFTCFHRHCPIIHVPSLDLRTTPSHLVLAICAIGALYRLNRKIAKDLWSWATQLVESEPLRKSQLGAGQISGGFSCHESDMLSKTSTASVQCRMLLGMFASFSGDLTARAISGAGYWSTVRVEAWY